MKKTKSKNLHKVLLWAAGIVGAGVLIFAGVDAYRSANTPEPAYMTMPEAIAFSYDAESDTWEAEDLGEEFQWDGAWHGDEDTIEAIKMLEEE